MMYKEFKKKCLEIFDEKEPLLLEFGEQGRYFKINKEVFFAIRDGYEWNVFKDWHRDYYLIISYKGWRSEFIFEIMTPMGKMQLQIPYDFTVNNLKFYLDEVFRTYANEALRDE